MQIVMNDVMLVPDEIYIINYKLNGQRSFRWAQLKYLGEGNSWRHTRWEGKPTIGLRDLFFEEIRSIAPLPGERVKYTFWDKKEMP